MAQTRVWQQSPFIRLCIRATFGTCYQVSLSPVQLRSHWHQMQEDWEKEFSTFLPYLCSPQFHYRIFRGQVSRLLKIPLLADDPIKRLAHNAETLTLIHNTSRSIVMIRHNPASTHILFVPLGCSQTVPLGCCMLSS